MSKKGIFVGLVNLCHIIRYHGGFVRFLDRLFMTDDAKIGYFVGKDKYGNCYYENNYYFFPSNRWVIYSRENFGLHYDGSQIASEWFNWMHHISDVPPDQDKDRVQYPWMLQHVENQTGTKFEYIPYNTVNPKIHAWKPPKKPTPPIS